MQDFAGGTIGSDLLWSLTATGLVSDAHIRLQSDDQIGGFVVGFRFSAELMASSPGCMFTRVSPDITRRSAFFPSKFRFLIPSVLKARSGK